MEPKSARASIRPSFVTTAEESLQGLRRADELAGEVTRLVTMRPPPQPKKLRQVIGKVKK